LRHTPEEPIGTRGFLHRAVRSFTHAAFGNAASFVIAFVFAGLMIRFLGRERSGYLLMLQSFLGLSVIISQGVGAAAIGQLARYRMQGAHVHSQRLVSSLLSLQMVVGAVWALALALAFPLVARWSQLDPQYLDDARSAMWLTAVGFWVAQASSTANTVFQAYERYDYVSAINSVFGLLSGLTCIAILSVHPSMTSVAVGTLAINCCRLPVEALLLRTTLGGYPYPGWDFQTMRPLGHFGLWTMLGGAGGALFVSADRLVLGGLMGARALPYYSIAQRLFAQVHAALSSQYQFLFPLLAANRGSTAAEVVRLDDRLRWYLASISVALYGALALAATPILSHIVGAPLTAADKLPMVLACAQGVLHAAMIVPYYETWALGLAAPNAIAQLANGALCVSTMAILIPLYGVVGASIAQLWIGPVALTHGIWTARRLYDDHVLRRWMSPLITPIASAIPWIVAAGLLFGSSRDTQTAIAISAAAVVSVAGLSMFETQFFPDKQRWDTVVRALRIVVAAKG